MLIPEGFRSSLICSAEGDPPAGGGGGGGDSEQETRDLIMRAVNAAVTSQLSRKLPEAIKDGMTEALTPLQEQLAKMGGSDAGKTGDGDKGKGAGEDPQLAKFQAEQEAMRRQMEAERAEHRAELAKRQEGELTASLKDKLGAAGVEPLRLNGALAVVRGSIKRDKDGKVVNAEDGKPIWTAQRKGYTEDLGLEAGIAEWLGTDEGKAYKAPQAAAGSGNLPGRGGGPGPGNTPPDPAAQKAQKRAEAAKNLTDQCNALLSNQIEI